MSDDLSQNSAGETNGREADSDSSSFPQGLKPVERDRVGRTTEVVPVQNAVVPAPLRTQTHKIPQDRANSPVERPPIERAPLAYENSEFLNGPDGRVIRILAEYTEPLARFQREHIQDTVVFFGSARFCGIADVEQESESESGVGSERPLDFLANTGSLASAPLSEQPATAPEIAQGKASELGRRRAVAAVEMARYYEDARRLAYMITEWAQTLPSGALRSPTMPHLHRFVVTSGGGPGIMEAANRGAYEAGGKTIGLNIKLPFEQRPNPYVTPELNFEFHYFFMRKLWFAYLAKALVVFPGGFGTIDEMFEVLTLAQTHKLAKQITVVIYGSEYWKKVINLEALVDTGAISPKDVELFQFADTPEEAFEVLKDGLVAHQFELEPQRQPRPSSPEDLIGPEFARTL